MAANDGRTDRPSIYVRPERRTDLQKHEPAERRVYEGHEGPWRATFTNPAYERSSPRQPGRPDGLAR